MNRKVILAAILAAVSALTGCQAAEVVEEEHDPKIFGATYMTRNNPYFDVLHEAIENVVEANGDIVISRNPCQDQEKQNGQILEMLDEGIEVLFLNPVDWETVKPALEECQKRGVIVINMDTVVKDQEYVALAYKYRLIDQDYKLAVLPQVLCNVEYQEDGSSGTMWKQYLKNPKGFAFWRKICMRYPESRKRKIVDCIHYCSSSQIAKDKWYIRESPAKFMTFLCSPLGVVLTMMVKHKARK